ncbi:MAG: calcium/sodium antiporter, partial [Acidimicrobiales bacterium]|nr:calcium/sodium antiporter [Acidimicrobiales bacterium]
VVAFGTSAPELAVSTSDAFQGQGNLAIGNVVGSNIANVLLILGLAALVGGGLLVHERIVRLDVPLMVGASLLVTVLALDGSISTVEGGLLFGLIVAYVAWTVRAARREGPEVVAENEEAIDTEALARTPLAMQLGFIVAGLVGLVVGARWLVSAASTVAADLGASELVIGLTVVAIGTSMPELATSIVAVLRGQRDIAVGNVVGSNLFNLLSVLGAAALAAPGGIHVPEAARTFDLPVMTAVAVACLPVFFDGYVLKRWEGAVFFAYYAAYLTYLVLDATDHAAVDPFRLAMAAFVLPLTVLTLVVVGRRAWVSHRAAPRR